MRTGQIIHVLPCDERVFWERCFFHYAFNVGTYRGQGDGWELLHQALTPDGLVRRMRVQPPMPLMPVAVSRLMGEGFSYIEEGVFDARTRRYTFRGYPSRMQDQIYTAGEIWLEPIGTQSVHRVMQMTVRVDIPALGPLMELMAEGVLRQRTGSAVGFQAEFAGRAQSGWIPPTPPDAPLPVLPNDGAGRDRQLHSIFRIA